MKALLTKMGVHNKEDAIRILGQFFKFSIVGVSNTLISLGIYYLLLFFSVHYIAANACGFFVSVINAYYWNNKYVFKTPGTRDARPFIKTFLAYGSTFLLGMGLLYLMVDVLGISNLIAPVVNLCVTVPLNFLLNKFWAYK